jgi:hypothetical protein
MTEPQRFHQSYDQLTFIAEVQALLRERGLMPDLPHDRYDQAIAGAQQLLASMGIVPTIPMDVALSLNRDTDWMDHDDQHLVGRTPPR